MSTLCLLTRVHRTKGGKVPEKLPYFNSKTQPHLAINRIKKILEKFKVSQVNFGEDFDEKEIRITFIHKKIPVCLPVNYGFLAKKYRDCDTYCKGEETYLKMALNASYAVIEDYLKAMLTMHELGIMTLEEIFLPNLLTNDGVRLAERLQSQMPKLLAG